MLNSDIRIHIHWLLMLHEHSMDFNQIKIYENNIFIYRNRDIKYFKI